MWESSQNTPCNASAVEFPSLNTWPLTMPTASTGEKACFRQMTDCSFPQVFFVSLASISAQGAVASNGKRCNGHTGLTCIIKANIYIKHNTAIYLDA